MEGPEVDKLDEKAHAHAIVMISTCRWEATPEENEDNTAALLRQIRSEYKNVIQMQGVQKIGAKWSKKTKTKNYLKIMRIIENKNNVTTLSPDWHGLVDPDSIQYKNMKKKHVGKISGGRCLNW